MICTHVSSSYICACWIRFRFPFVLCFVSCVFFYVSLGHFVLVLLAFVVGYLARRLAGKNVSEMTYFVSSGM